jgi:hypothetical protein
MLRIRPHHLLCICLYTGKGYDEAFVDHMDHLVGWFGNDPDAAFRLVMDSDDVCSACPNLTAQRMCALGECDIRRKDRIVLETLGLCGNNIYPYADTIAWIKLKVTREVFDACCGDCRWHRAEICSYETLLDRLSDIVIMQK